MEKDSGKVFHELKEDVSTYVELKLELLKLSTYERSGQLIATLSYGLILLCMAFFAKLFIFLALGFFLGDLFGSMAAGFAAVAVIYLLLIGLIILNKQKICKIVLNVVIAALNGNDEKDDATDTKQDADTAGEADF